MVCEKCDYQDKKESEKFGKRLCQICFYFAPDNKEDFDWKILDTFRKFNQALGKRQIQEMDKKAQNGKLMSRAPLGYNVLNGQLIQNEKSSKVHSLFKIFLEKNYSLNSLAKNYSLSVNGLKKVLSNRTYLGEIKFAGKLNKGKHQPIISPEIFYAVQRKLKEICRS